jgi:hypothetical protein
MRYRAFDRKIDKLGLYNTPVSPNRNNLASYISGYVDGEGSFCVSICKNSKYRLGWEVRPSFSVSQNKNRSQVLKIINEHFDCGSIRQNISDATLKYEVRSIKDLITKIIPHFEEYPILSDKQSDFSLFKDVCVLVSRKEHLTKAGLRAILKLVSKMNPSGIRKYDPREIKI